MDTLDLSLTGPLEIGSLAVNLGINADSASFSSSTDLIVAGGVSFTSLDHVGGNVTVANGTVSTSTSTTFSGSLLDVEGGFSITNKDGNVANNLSVTNLDVKGTFTIINGSTLALSNTLLQSTLSYTGGTGIDALSITTSSLRGNLTVNTVGGADTITIENSLFSGTVSIQTGIGMDTVTIEGLASRLGSTFAKAISILTGDDANTIIAGATANRAATFKVGLTLDGGNGADTLTPGANLVLGHADQHPLIRSICGIGGTRVRASACPNSGWFGFQAMSKRYGLDACEKKFECQPTLAA